MGQQQNPLKRAMDLNQKVERNPAINLIDGGASKEPPKKTLRYAGSMMSPRTPMITAIDQNQPRTRRVVNTNTKTDEADSDDSEE